MVVWLSGLLFYWFTVLLVGRSFGSSTVSHVVSLKLILILKMPICDQPLWHRHDSQPGWLLTMLGLLESLAISNETRSGTSNNSDTSTIASSLLLLDQQGNAGAIAHLMKWQLQRQGITARIYRQGERLQVVLTADQAPPEQLAIFVQTGLLRLRPRGIIQRVSVFGKQRRNTRSAWQHQFSLI
jgi:hypothetical protein